VNRFWFSVELRYGADHVNCCSVVARFIATETDTEWHASAALEALDYADTRDFGKSI